jgi:hypothetical protein
MGVRRLSLTVLPVLALALAACGGASSSLRSTTGSTGVKAAANDPTTQGPLVFQGNFSDPGQAWPTSSGPGRSESASDDTYTVAFSSAGGLDASPTIATVQPQDLINASVSVSVTSASTAPGDDLGVFCRGIQGHSYAFFFGPSSSGQLAWSIQRRQHDGNRFLARGTTAIPTGSSYSVRGDCVEGGANHKPVVLALYLNDQLIGQARDAKLPTPYLGLPGISVSSATGTTRVSFSNFQVRGASAS